MTDRPTIDEIYAHKKLAEAELRADLGKLLAYSATEPKRCFAGNKFLYHHQIENLCSVRIGTKPCLADIVADPEAYDKLLEGVERMGRTGTMPNRVYEHHRFNGACVMFAPSTAKFVYRHFKATHVLDPTAGWGGRMLGAWAAGCDYTGIDTNVSLRPAYEDMMGFLSGRSKLQMLWTSCLAADFSTIPYDFVLTSPPYINKEVYPGMTPFESKAAFYSDFLIPLITKCLAHIKPGGWVCFNISPPMYAELTRLEFRPADREVPLLQQKRLGVDKGDKIYCWRG